MLFDPSHMAPIDRLVRVGTGRDAKDVAFATIFGNVQMLRKELIVDEGEVPPGPGSPPGSHPPLLSLVST